MTALRNADSVDSAAALLKALADPTRLRVLWLLAARERSVSELAEEVGAHVAALSQHLAKLRAAGLVVSRRDGTRIFYRPSTAQMRAFLDEVVLLNGHITGELTVPPSERASGAASERPAEAPARAGRATGRSSGRLSPRPAAS